MNTADDHGVRFTHSQYTIRTKFFRVFGNAFHIYDDQGNVVLYSDMKRFRLKEDIRLYDGEAKNQELLRISTQSIFDISGAYDVHDSATGQRIGTVKREGLSSTFLRDQWTFHGADGNEIGTLREDSALKGLARRYVDAAAFLLPQHYHAEVGGRTVAVYRQRFNPVIYKLDVAFDGAPHAAFDRRLGIAAGVLISAIEGRE